jgi:hypothetical protein
MTGDHLMVRSTGRNGPVKVMLFDQSGRMVVAASVQHAPLLCISLGAACGHGTYSLMLETATGRAVSRVVNW